MSTLAADVPFDFTFQPCDPLSPPALAFPPALLELPPYTPGHARSSSQSSSVYSFESSPSDSVPAPSTARTTPARSPIRTHGPLLLPKIRSQDQAMMPSAEPTRPAKRARTSPAPTPAPKKQCRSSHSRSLTSPETLSYSAALFANDSSPAPLLCSPVAFARDPSMMHARRASACSLNDVVVFPSFQLPAYAPPARLSGSPSPPPQPPVVQPLHPAVPQVQPEPYLYDPYLGREASPLAPAATITPEPVATTTLYSFLTSPNPAPALVRTLSFPLRDPHQRHFWWDVRQVRPWTDFTASGILSFPGAAACLSAPIPANVLPAPPVTQRHPETEQDLHAIYAAHYLPKLNSALALCSRRPLRLAVPPKASSSPAALGMATDCMFVASAAGESPAAAVMFGGKPTARVVGLVKSFDRFNTGMRAEGNIKRVEYLRGLAHLHHAMREHGCRYGFILTEIELVVVRNGTEHTPHFGFLEVASVQLASTDDLHEDGSIPDADEARLTACLALWGLCMLAGDEPMPGHAHWRAEIGAPADGTRRKALPRDGWMPQPQLAEKREAKRARGWVLPECPVGRKEVGKRGVKYGSC
ncbi:hypothetical protein VTJ83DRAFT_2353 [Remersonia thermophila]|uniref:Sialidase n=1 Tax=Remersonia thermophila TaxID=72144 RepID=A0ABR4DJH3_9PEZI